MFIRVLSIIICILVLPISVVNAKELGLEDALALAGVKDPALQSFEAKSAALKDKSISSGQLPDPKAKLAMQNFPTDSFSYTQEPMTQIVAGVSQAFPRGKTLKYESKKLQAKARIEDAKLLDASLKIKLEVKKAWLDIFYWQEALKTIDKSKKLLHEVIHATESAYSTGRQNSQDIVGAELELSVLEDKRIDANRNLEKAKAELAKWIGPKAASRKVSAKIPDMAELKDYAEIEKLLVKHPKVIALDATIEAKEQGINIAKEQYKPGFNVGVNYGNRGDGRSDFVSAMLSFDIPLFTKKRQDKDLSASKFEKASVLYKRDDILRNLKEMLDREYANYKRLSERETHYKKDVIKKAEENFAASLRAYQQDLTDFSSLIRAQVMELNTKLKWKKIMSEQAKAKAALIYLQGGK